MTEPKWSRENAMRNPETTVSLARDADAAVVDVTESGDGYVVRIEFPESLKVFEGHFPGNPIVPGVMLVEYGSGSSVKTRVLLEHLPEVVAYVPVDISRKHLQNTCRNLEQQRLRRANE